MVPFAASDLKDIFTFRLKKRQDAYTDQFSRIFMVKMLMISSIVMGVDWFQDTINCMIPAVDLHKVREQFVHSACWIQGFYIYPELSEMVDHTNYYGIPKDISMNGFNHKGQLCEVQLGRFGEYHDCRPLKRFYFLQYQWMPFFVASAAILYYLPYIIFQIFNTDVQCLKVSLGNEKVTSNDVFQKFFNYDVNTLLQMRLNLVMNMLVKWCYLAVNIGVFYLSDHLLNGHFRMYGKRWIQWSVLSNQEAFHFKTGLSVKPGNLLLPSFGFCEIFEASVSETFKYKNKSKFICEISLNVMYQYIFVILWFLMLAGIFISACGIVLNIAGHVITVMHFIRRDVETAKSLLRVISFRECEYLSIIRRRDNQLYRNLLEKLYKRQTKKELHLAAGTKAGLSHVNDDLVNSGKKTFYDRMSPMKML